MSASAVAIGWLLIGAISSCASFSIPLSTRALVQHPCRCITIGSTTSRLDATKVVESRRQWLLDSIRISVAGTTFISPWFPSAVTAVEASSIVVAKEDTTEADLLLTQVTDRIYVDIKAPTEVESRRIVIGLYGKAAPSSTRMLRQLVSSTGLPSKCKPRDTTRTLQKEQLEANKVYSSCIENETKGVNYEYGTIWRIIKDERIDVGSVSGKFVAREFPNWAEDENNPSLPTLPMEFGSVSVQRGNESGFGFSIYPGKDIKTDVGDAIVVGRVLEGLDVIEQLNNFQVVKSSKVNYMALTGSDGMKKAPSRACSYGSSNLYCNEFKPLQKLSITATGVL